MRLALVLLACIASHAVAETKADALFKKAKQQLADKKFAEACETFEQVDKIDTGIGAKLNVGKCYEEWGKLAIAYKWYADALAMAKSAKDKRLDKIKELTETLDSDVPRLTLKLPAKIDPVTAAVKIDGKPFPTSDLGKELRVDPGAHTIAYVAGGKPRTKSLSLERGASTEIELVFDKADEGKQPPPPPPGGGPPTPPRNYRLLAGIGVGSLGILGVGISSVLTLSARSTYKDALADHCRGQTDMCSPEGIVLTDNAKSRANVATVIGVIGLAAIAGGAVLYVTSRKKTARKAEHAIYVAPAVDGSSASVLLGGGF